MGTPHYLVWKDVELVIYGSVMVYHTLMLEGSTLAVKMDFLLLYDRWQTSAQACMCC